MKNDRIILVLGATGQQGGSTASALRGAGWPVRAFVRDAAEPQASALAALGCTIVEGNLNDRASIRRALAGVHGVFAVLPSSGQGVHGITDADETAFGTQIAEDAQAAGVRHYVYSSFAGGGGGRSGVGHFDSKVAIEAHLAAMTMPITVIRPTTIMEILTQPGLGVGERRLSFFTQPDTPVQFIAAKDIGRIAAAVFAAPDRFAGQSFEIAGDTVTGNELAASLSIASGIDIGYQRFPAAILDADPTLKATARLFEHGPLSGRADIAFLRELVPDLLTIDRWLAGPGAGLLTGALAAGAGSLALR